MRVLTLLFSLLCLDCFAQKNIPTTDAIVIEGAVKKGRILTLDSLKKYPTEKIDSLVILNHLGERKSVLKDIRGISLRRILSELEIDSESPKQLSEFYFVMTAADGYKVVFSWNEIFNHPAGEGIYIIAGVAGKNLETLENRIAVFSKTDTMSGRRYVKGLQKIVVKRAE